MDADDRRDVAATLQGDEDAFARLVRRHQQTVARSMHRFTRDPGQRDELVQDVFVEAYTSLGGFAGRAPFAHWLRRIAVRVGYRFWKVRARRLPAGDTEALEALPAPDDTEARAAAEWVHALLARLRPRDRLVLTLLHLEGCTVAEIADLTGWSRPLVKVAAFRARRRLADLAAPELDR